QHDALSVIDNEETLELAKESTLKMHAKQNDPIAKEKKVNIAPIDYVALNKFSEHFVKHFMPKKQLSTKQAFWLPISQPVSENPLAHTEPVLKEIPRELPKISLVKDSFNKMRSHVNDFDNIITVRTKVTGQNEGTWGLFEIELKELIIENDRLLEQIICQDVMSVVMHDNSENVLPANNSSIEHDNSEAELLKKENDRLFELTISQDLVHCHTPKIKQHQKEKSYLDEYAECGQLKAELSKKNDMAEKALICATCNECIFDAIHDFGVLEYVNDVNVHVKSKCVKSKKKKLWKPTGKVFTDVRYSWKPTSQSFTIDGNTCPLTRITSTIVVPPKKPISPIIVKKTPPNSNNSGKLKDITNIRSSSKSKSVESKISNNSEPIKNWGSNVSTSLSPSRVHFRSFKSSSSTWTQVALSKGQGNALSSSTLLVNSWVLLDSGIIMLQQSHGYGDY
ncbi:hypothetical protein Tco_1141616, partial [Tanacetum coccineum]